MPLIRRLVLLVVAALVVASCSSAAAAPDIGGTEEPTLSTPEAQATATSGADDADLATSTTAEPSSSTTAAPSMAAPTTAPTTAPTSTEPPTTEPDPCSPWIEIGDTEVGRWFVVNDDVMGGRSEGGLLIEGAELRFSGSVNNDGGGFASIRRGVEPGDLDGFTGVRISAIGDGRTYQFRAHDDADGRNRRVNHRTEMVLGPGPTTVELAFADMTPGVFGQDVEDAPLVPASIEWVGIMIADGVDGPFEATITSIERCR